MSNMSWMKRTAVVTALLTFCNGCPFLRIPEESLKERHRLLQAVPPSAAWAQCGGTSAANINFNPICVTGYTCVVQSTYYSQCKPCGPGQLIAVCPIRGPGLSAIPSTVPSVAPASVKSAVPSSAPKSASTNKPAAVQSSIPSASPTKSTSKAPTKTTIPTTAPTKATETPSTAPTKTPVQTWIPSTAPTKTPVQTWIPSTAPTKTPVQTWIPSTAPTKKPATVGCTNIKLSQCGGKDFIGQTCCPVGTCCTYSNLFFSDCQPSTAIGCAGVATSAVPLSAATNAPFKAVPNGNTAHSYPICAKTNGAKVVYTAASINTAYNNILVAYKAAVAAQPTPMSLANLLGASLRMAFHDAVDLDLTKPDLMGADGCIGDSQGSAGLVELNSPIYTVMEPIYQANCDKINRADFFVLFAKFVVELSEPTNSIKLPFQYGRRETQDCSAGIGRDPDAQDGFAAVKQSFVTQMGLSYTDAVVLSGAHTIGHVHASGFNGHPGADMNADPSVNAWDNTPTKFDNGYFVQLIAVGWATINNNNDPAQVEKNIWIDMNCGANGQGNTTPDPTNINACQGVAPFTIQTVGSKNIDLNTDMALAFPLIPVTTANKFNGNLLQYPDGEIAAKPLQHCVMDRNQEAGHQVQLNDFRCYGPGDGLPAGQSDAPFDEFQFVAGPFVDDATITIPAWNDPTGTLQTILTKMLPLVISFSRPTDGSTANTNFLRAFEKSWVKMVSAGYTELTGTAGKLGALTNY